MNCLPFLPALLILTTFAPIALQAETRVVTPPGAYVLVRLTLDKVGQDKIGLPVQIAFREGKGLHAYSTLPDQFTCEVRDMRLYPTTLQGLLRHRNGDSSKKRSETAFTDYRLEGKVKDGKITGIYRKVDGTSANLTGELIDMKELAKSNAVSPGKQWPTWHGPTGNFIAPPGQGDLIESLDQARLIWRSEDILPASLGSIVRVGRASEAYQRGIGGGGSSPVLADGKIYLSYHVPSGSTTDERLFQDQVVYNEARGLRMDAVRERKRYLVGADDVVVCLDAATGATLWKTTGVDKGVNWQDHKTGPCNCTPCVADGKVFTIGTTGRVHALDAKTGKKLWDGNLGKRHNELEEEKKKALQERRLARTGSRMHGGAPVFAEGLVILPDFAGGLLALDGKDGKQRWLVEKGSTQDATPVVWQSGGKTFVLSTGPGRVICVEVPSGKVAWTIDDPMLGSLTPAVRGEWMVVRTHKERGKEAEGTFHCYRISKERAEKQWSLAGPTGSQYLVPPLSERHVYLRGHEEVWCVDLEQGKPVAKIASTPGGSNSQLCFLADDRLFIRPDGKHGKSEFLWCDARPDKFRMLGKAWVPPSPNTTSYHVPMTYPFVDGRLFVRGDDGVYCYDLRKQN